MIQVSEFFNIDALNNWLSENDKLTIVRVICRHDYYAVVYDPKLRKY